MPEQDLHCSQIAGLLVDKGSLGASEGVSSVVLLPKPDTADPFFDQPRVLSSAEMVEGITASRDGLVFNLAATTFQPCEQACTGGFEQLELHRPFSLLLDDQRAISNATT